MGKFGIIWESVPYLKFGISVYEMAYLYKLRRADKFTVSQIFPERVGTVPKPGRAGQDQWSPK